jgi:hypothetical protein
MPFERAVQSLHCRKNYTKLSFEQRYQIQAPQQVVTALEMPNARRRNAMPTKPKPLNSMIA